MKRKLVMVSLGDGDARRIVDADIDKTVVVDGEEFRPVSKGGSISMFDWLRDAAGEILGVRFWMDMMDRDSLEILRERDPWVVESGDDNYLKVFFGDDRDFVEDESQDADIGFSALCLKAGNRQVILFFDVPQKT
jgi:hypothetical protein